MLANIGGLRPAPCTESVCAKKPGSAAGVAASKPFRLVGVVALVQDAAGGPAREAVVAVAAPARRTS